MVQIKIKIYQSVSMKISIYKINALRDISTQQLDVNVNQSTVNNDQENLRR